MSLCAVNTALACYGLRDFGAFLTTADDDLPKTGTVVMVGPKEPGFWAHFVASPEYKDGAPDPMNRWSTRVLAQVATELGASALFPFGGPPYQPFIAWAQRTGHTWQSPVGLLVNAEAGLMVSYRGALALPERIDLPNTPPNPCETCEDKPCLSACPVGALTSDTYDIPSCHGYLDTPEGADCIGQGCAVRRVCPVSQTYGRLPAQSAFHMRAFHR
jgi:hypothetical protein